ncbi:hypothetical protein TWF718_009303 [Orbilia javanica]|uniref:Uncharacterized protein n=1 Tax=Orbilia javanica TaxID=47235 RepID=A0AAN8MP89_9PEZI
MPSSKWMEDPGLVHPPSSPSTSYCSTSPPPPDRKSTIPPHIASGSQIKKPEGSHHPRAPPTETTNGHYLFGGIVMPPCSCNDPSCAAGGKPPGYIIGELASQSGESTEGSQTPVVHLPGNVPPPIVMSDTGYPMGIAGPDGSPAWARPKTPTNEHGHEHGRHKNAHRSHHHNHPHAGFQTGPEYLVPMGTPVPNPYGPGVLFLPPKDPRIIPCRPAQDPGRYLNYNDFDAIQDDRYHHQGRHAAFEDLNTEYARMKMRAEQSERARLEEIERNQALWNARQKECEKKTWFKAMGVNREESEIDASNSAHQAAVYDDERVININVRQPCDNCQEPVTVETVHQRFSAHDGDRGIGINLDSPAPKPNKEFLCDKCKIAQAEEEKNTNLLRKLVQQVFTEADTIKKAKDAESNARIPSLYNKGAPRGNHPEPADSGPAPKESFLHHDKKKPTSFESMPEGEGPSNPYFYAHDSKHRRLHGRIKSPIPNLSDDENDGEYPIPKGIQAKKPKSGTKSGNHLSRSVLAALDEEHITHKDNIHIISSHDPNDEDEEEVIVIRRARRHNDKARGEGSRSHPTLVKSATENPEEALEAIARRLVNQLVLSPTKVDNFRGPRNLRKKGEGNNREMETDSDSSGHSAFVTKHQHSTSNVHQHHKHNRTGRVHREAYRHAMTSHEHRRHHHQDRFAENDNENHPRSQRRHRADPEDNPRGPSDNAPTGIFSNWGLFRKPTF